MNVQPQRTLSIVLLPSGTYGQQVLAVARSWAGEGLLKRGLWVSSDKVQTSQHGGAVVDGVLLDQIQEREVDVAQLLASVRLNALTMVVLQMFTAGQSVDEAQSKASDRLAEALVNSRPESLLPDSGHDPVNLTIVNLLAGPTGTSGIPFAQAAAKVYAHAVVAAPEDRRAGDQMDRFVRPDDNFVPWATAQACTLAGMWSGMTQTPWDASPAGLDGSSSLAQGDFAIPMRSFTRVVTSAPTARRALALAMDETRFAKGNVLFSDKLLPVSDSEAILVATLDAFDKADNSRLSYETPPPGLPPQRLKKRLASAVSEFLRFSGREIIGVPRFVVQRMSARWSHRATRALSGDDGAEEITVRGEGSDLSIYQEEFERQAVQAERSLSAMPPGVPPSAPELWRTLAQSTLGLLDGSTMPTGVPTPMIADKRVVLPSALLAVPTPKGWQPESDIPEDALGEMGVRDMFIAPCDARRAEAVAAILASQVETHTQNLREAEKRLMVAQAELDAHNALGDEGAPSSTGSSICSECGNYLVGSPDTCPECGADDEDFEVAPEAEVDGDQTGDGEDSDASDSRPGESPAQRRIRLQVGVTAAEMDAGDARRNASLAQRLSDTFEDWVSERQSSLFWRLSKRVHDRTTLAKKDADSFYAEAVAVPTIDIDEPRRARNEFANRFLLFLAIGILLVALTWRYGRTLALWLGVPEWLPWAVVAVVIGVWLWIMLSTYYRRRSRFLKAVETLKFQQRDALDRCSRSAQAHSRLSGLYEQLIEWGEILGYTVHDPWRPDQRWFSGTVSADFSSTLPSCVDLAVPDPDDVAGTRLLHRAASRSITGEGWRAGSFYELHGLLLEDGGYDPGDPKAGALLFDDAPAAPNGTRAAMLERLRSGYLQEQCARRVLMGKIAGLYAERDTLTAHAVVPVNSEIAAEQTGLLDEKVGLEKLHPTWGQYLNSALVGTTRFGVSLWSAKGRTDTRTRSTMTTLRYAPPGLTLSEELSGAELRPALPADLNRGVEVVVRCDFGPPVESDSLLLFTQETLVPDSATQTPDQLDPRSRGPHGRPDKTWADDVGMFN